MCNQNRRLNNSVVKYHRMIPAYLWPMWYEMPQFGIKTRDYWPAVETDGLEIIKGDFVLIFAFRIANKMLQGPQTNPLDINASMRWNRYLITHPFYFSYQKNANRSRPHLTELWDTTGNNQSIFLFDRKAFHASVESEHTLLYSEP